MAISEETLKDQIMTIDTLMQEFESLAEEVKKSKQEKYDAIIQDITDRINTILGLTEENRITLERCIELVKSIGETENNDGGGVVELMQRKVRQVDRKLM